jgi:hypothetical protein
MSAHSHSYMDRPASRRSHDGRTLLAILLGESRVTGACPTKFFYFRCLYGHCAVGMVSTCRGLCVSRCHPWRLQKYAQAQPRGSTRRLRTNRARRGAEIPLLDSPAAMNRFSRSF